MLTLKGKEITVLEQHFSSYLKFSAIFPFQGPIAFYVAKIKSSCEFRTIGPVANPLSMALVHVELSHIFLQSTKEDKTTRMIQLSTDRTEISEIASLLQQSRTNKVQKTDTWRGWICYTVKKDWAQPQLYFSHGLQNSARILPISLEALPPRSNQ